jgi:hypothetical protein
MPTSPASPGSPEARHGGNRDGWHFTITQDWSLLGNFRYDIATEQTITDGWAYAIRTTVSCLT